MRLSLVFALAASAALFACGGVSATQCKKGDTVCVSDSVARLCADDGTFVDQLCNEDQTCMGSTGCIARTDIACQPSDSACTDSSHALVCNANGVGFQNVTCPTGTVCGGQGVCVGTCVVGSSRCNGDGIVETCMDGFTYQQADCTPGMTTCVTTSGPGARITTVACKPMGCVPQGVVCGDKAMDPANTDPNFASACEESPDGLHWTSEQCLQPGSCVPGNGCTTQCQPGAKRCANTGIQTCDANGKWGATTSCTATSTGAQQICQYVQGYNDPVCGDPVCASYPGACEQDGYHPCVNGKVAAAPQACAIGVCAGGSVINGFTGGSCQPECAPGDSKCDGGEAFQSCTAQFRWSSTATTCPVNGTDRCVQYSDDVTGGPRTVCGVCVPGTHRCTDSSGNSTTPGSDIEACNSTGHYDTTHQACTVGQCQYSSSNGDYACLASCQPGATVCMGSTASGAPDPLHPGTTNYGTCDNNGNLPTSGGTACATGTTCRKGPNGQPVGVGAAACVVCVGPNITGGNELGLVDSYCTSGTQLETCNASNTWSSVTTCPTSSPYTGACKQESPYQQTRVCNGYYFCTDTVLHYYGYTNGCSQFWGSSSVQWGNTPDCCQDPYGYCRATSNTYSPNPAACQ